MPAFFTENTVSESHLFDRTTFRCGYVTFYAWLCDFLGVVMRHREEHARDAEGGAEEMQEQLEAHAQQARQVDQRASRTDVHQCLANTVDR